MGGSPGEAATAAAQAAPDLAAPPLRLRMACWLYEGVLMFGVLVPAGMVFSVGSQMRHALMYRSAFIAFLFAVLALYFGWFWTRGGQTLAMKTWRLKVVDSHGRPLAVGRALLRYVLCWIWLLPPLAVAAPLRPRVGGVALLILGWVVVWALLSRFHPQRQFWHDAMAGTRLVRAPNKASRGS